MSPGRLRPRLADRVSRIGSLARWLAEWLAGAVAILSLGNKVPPIPGLWGMRLSARLKNGRPNWQPVCQSHGHGLPLQAQVALAALGTGTLSGQSSGMGFNSLENPSAEDKQQPPGKT